jgi:hypothetical protein
MSLETQPMPMRSGSRALHTWLVALITLPYVAFVTYGDVTCFLELWYPLRWLFAAYYVMLVAWLARRPAGKWIAGIALAWMLLVLPQVRWNDVKTFYVDARRLRTGMTVAEVRGIMSPHLELGAFEATREERGWLPITPDPADALIFLHSPLGWTDHCEVRLDARGRVSEIGITKD